ncbi:MAG: hypothetical protein ACYTFG_17210, partial [Planctomycetota bacterium]
AVAVIAAAVLIFSVFPEIIPAYSGVCNLGLVGLFLGLLLLGVLPGIRWMRNVTARWALPALLIAVVLVAAPDALAGQASGGDESRVYIPYDPAKAEKGIPVDKVFLPYKEFLRLWDLAYPDQATQPTGPDAPFAHVQAHYVGEMSQGWLKGGAVFTVKTRGPNPVEVPLGLKGAMVEVVKVNDKEAALRETKSGYAFAASKEGEYTINVSFRVKAKGEGKSGRVSLGLFPIPRSSATITLVDPILTCEIPSALGGLERSKRPDSEVITAYLGATDKLVVEVRPREAERGGELSTLKARTQTTLAAEPGTQKLVHTCAFEVVGRPPEKFDFTVSEELQILSVKGPNIRIWGRPEGKKDTLEIHLQKPEEKGGTYVIEALRSLEDGARKGALPKLHPRDCFQERGILLLECPGHIQLQAETELDHVERRGFKPWIHPIASAFRFSGRPIDVKYALKDKPPRLEGHLDLAMMVGEEDARLGAFLHVSSSGSPVFRLTASLPAGFRLDGVHPVYGPRIKDWWGEQKEGKHELHIRLQRGLRDQMGFVVWMSKRLKGASSEVPMPSVILKGAEAHKGRIVIHSFPGIHLVARDLTQNLESEPAYSIWHGFCRSVKRPCPPVREGALGYKFDGTEVGGTIVAKRQPPVLSCRWTLHKRLRKDSVEYGIYFDYRAENAPTRSLAFSLPSWIPADRVVIPEFQGKRGEDPPVTEDGRTLYRVNLRRGFLGNWKLAVYVSLPLGEGEAGEAVELPLVLPEDLGESEVTGYVVVENDEGGAELREQRIPEGLTRIDAEGLRKAGAFPAGLDKKDVTFAYRASKNYGGAFRLETLKVEESVDVEVNRIEMMTVLQERGDSWNRATFRVTNRARQFLEIVLPGGSHVLSLFVDGSPVRPGTGG